MNIVVSRYNKNVDWVYRLKGENKIFIYDKETPENPYNIPVNKGNEASVYLKYIIDHYDNLSTYTFFIHDDEYTWHHFGSIVDKFDEAVSSHKMYYNINDNCVLGSILTNEWYSDIIEWYKLYVENYIPLHTLPNKDWTNGYRGSAQFLVHKQIITNLPKKFYEDLYHWIITTDMPSSKSGRFLEWTWHLFWDIYPNSIDGINSSVANLL